MNFGDFIAEKAKQEGNRLPLKSFKSIKKKNETGHAADTLQLEQKQLVAEKELSSNLRDTKLPKETRLMVVRVKSNITHPSIVRLLKTYARMVDR